MRVVLKEKVGGRSSSGLMIVPIVGAVEGPACLCGFSKLAIIVLVLSDLVRL